MKISKELVRNVVLYGIIGSGSATLDFGIFALLYNVLSLNEFVANIISIHCGIASSFYLNRKYNFKREDKVLFRATSFYLTGLFGLLLSTGILALGKYFDLSANLAKLTSVFIVAAAQFTINKLITFRR
jgi:putative flippase GtrA